jgi:RecB family endonuclease NucS
MALEEIRLWAMDGAGDATSLETADQTKSERLLEDTLVKNPEMLMPGLTLVGRQTPTEGGHWTCWA